MVSINQAAIPDHVELSPTGFKIWAEDFYRCRTQFQKDGFSPIPYFLLCRSIELYFKSIHLETLKDPNKLKKFCGHNLIKSYFKLPDDKKTLDAAELSILYQANNIYDVHLKGFEYFIVEYAVRGFSDFPNLASLDAIAAKLLA